MEAGATRRIAAVRRWTPKPVIGPLAEVGYVSLVPLASGEGRSPARALLEATVERALSARTERVPCPFVAEIDKGSDHKAKGRQTRRGGDIRDHHVVSRKVYRCADSPKSYGL